MAMETTKQPETKAKAMATQMQKVIMVVVAAEQEAVAVMAQVKD